MRVLIVGTSLDPASKSQILAREAVKIAKDLNLEPELLDLRELTLPFAGEADSFDDVCVDDVSLAESCGMGTGWPALCHPYALGSTTPYDSSACPVSQRAKVEGDRSGIVVSYCIGK